MLKCNNYFHRLQRAGATPGTDTAGESACQKGALTHRDRRWVERGWMSKQQVDEPVWVEVYNVDDFNVETTSGDKLVLVEFVSPGCLGACVKFYSRLRNLLKDQSMRQEFKLVKARVDDELHLLLKQAGVVTKPTLAVYHPAEGRVVVLDKKSTKGQHLKDNLSIILTNPDMDFKLDGRGYVIPVARDCQQAVESTDVDATSISSIGATGAVPAATGTFPEATGSIPAASTFTAAVPNIPDVGSHYRPDSSEMAQAKEDFLEKYSQTYGYGGKIDELYHKEVGCRMGPHEHYIDYTSAAVYCQSQLSATCHDLQSCMLGNPHSENPSSLRSTARIEEVRHQILRYFNADPSEYQLVFTRNATDSLKMVGELFPWSEGSVYRYLRQNHNSVLGVREYALKNGAAFESVTEDHVQQWLSSPIPEAEDPAGDEWPPTFNLFAYPAEENYAGVKYPLEWVQRVQDRCRGNVQWKVMLDAAAHVPTQPLDLSKAPADFVALSFYKMVGYPTGLGGLIVRSDNMNMLKMDKVYFGGGTVRLATSKEHVHVFKCNPVDMLEDGTVSFLDIISLKHGFDMLEKLGGAPRIQAHVATLVEWLYDHLVQLQHSNGAPVVRIYGKHDLPDHHDVQGPTVNCSVLYPDGSFHGYLDFEREAAAAGFHVRTGAQCNPGSAYTYLGVPEEEVVEQLVPYYEGCGSEVEFLDIQKPGEAPKRVPLGSVRFSLGYMSTFEDCFALYSYIRDTYTDVVNNGRTS